MKYLKDILSWSWTRVRILGEINQDNISILQEADSIFIDELKKEGLYDEVSQAFCVYLPVNLLVWLGMKGVMQM